MLGIDYYVRVTSYVDRQGSDCYIYVALGIFSSLLVSLCWWENSLQATNRMQVHCFSIVELQLACILPSLYVYDKETFFFFYTITEDLFSSLIPQDTLSQLDGFRDFVFVISSILRILVIGNYLPSMSVLTQWMERRKKNMLAKLHPLCTGRVMKNLISHIHTGEQTDFCDVRGADGLQRMFSSCDEFFSCCFQY